MRGSAECSVQTARRKGGTGLRLLPQRDAGRVGHHPAPHRPLPNLRTPVQRTSTRSGLAMLEAPTSAFSRRAGFGGSSRLREPPIRHWSRQTRCHRAKVCSWPSDPRVEAPGTRPRTTIPLWWHCFRQTTRRIRTTTRQFLGWSTHRSLSYLPSARLDAGSCVTQKSAWSKIEQFVGPRLSLCTFAPTNQAVPLEQRRQAQVDDLKGSS